MGVFFNHEAVLGFLPVQKSSPMNNLSIACVCRENQSGSIIPCALITIEGNNEAGYSL